MRLTIVILIATFMQLSAAGYAQRISLSQKKTPLGQIFREIHNQTGYDFLYDAALLDTKQPVTITAKNELLEEVLLKCLSNQSLEYSIQDKTIFIKEKKKSVKDFFKEVFSSMDVRGEVIDDNGTPVAGATVREKGSSRSVTTDALGIFNLKGLNDDAVIEVSYVGFATKTIRAAAKMTIRLSMVTNELAEVMVNKGYYSETQKLSTGNSVTVTAVDIEKQPVLNPLLALQGRVPGLQITQSSGITNGPLNILIRGRSSLNEVVGNNPLFVVDGIPYQSLLLSDPLGNNGGNGVVASSPQGNPLNYINPNDIASITILKDADATAIYGSRGGNGVILIATKQGQPGKMSLGVNISQGFMQAPNSLKLMNTQQYLEMRREAFVNDGLPVPSIATDPNDPNFDVNGTWNQTTNTDWQDKLIGNFAAYSNLNLSLSGGSEFVNYSIRGTYNRQGNLYAGNFDDKRGGLSFNLNTYSKNKKFKLDLVANLLKDNNQNAQSDVTAYTLRAPNAPESLNADGTLNFGGPNSDNSNNPLAYTLRTYSNKTDNIVLSLRPSYTIAKGLLATANIGYTDLRSNIVIKQPLASFSPLYLSVISESTVNPLINTMNIQKTWIAEPQISYNFEVKNVRINALAGGTFQSSDDEGHYYVGNNFVSDAVIGNLANAGSLFSGDNGTSKYRYNALFSRLNFNLADKYILNLTGRRDGSSKFGPGRQFGNFYSFAGAWVFSSEKFIADHMSFLSLGKLRASYGTSGNDNITNYTYYDSYATRGVNTYQGMTGFVPLSLANPNVAWEQNAKLEVAMELGFFKERIFLSTAYYRNRASNQLLPYTIPSYTGFSNIPNYNFPATVQNAGIELSLVTKNISGKQFKWSSTFDVSFNHNKLLKFENLENSNYASLLEIGQPVAGRVRTWIYTGVDSGTGLYTALKNDGSTGSDAGNYVYRDGDYQTKVINTLPRYFGGMNNSFQYKGLQLDIFLQFVKQTGKLSLSDYAPGFFSTGLYDQLFTSGSNVPTEYLNRWQKPGDQASYQRYTQSAAGMQAYGTWTASDAAYVDASFIRAKNVTLSYKLPATFNDRLSIKNASLSLTAQNLFTITPYKGRDPETQSYGTLPPLKVFVLGLQVNL